MEKYMTIHHTETGDHANFFQYHESAKTFYKERAACGNRPVALYEKDSQGIYRFVVADGLEDY